MKLGAGPILLIAVGAGILGGILMVRVRSADEIPRPAQASQVARSEHTVATAERAPAAERAASPTSAGKPMPAPPAAPQVPTEASIVSAAPPGAPEIPVSLTLSPDPGGTSQTVLANKSAQALLVTLTVMSRKTGIRYTTAVTVPANGEAQLDGVPAEQGDQLVLASGEYKPSVSYYE